MARRLLSTIKNHEAQRCAKVYRDTLLRLYVVTYHLKGGEAPQELRTESREEAHTAAWRFAWPVDPGQGRIPT